MTTSWRKQSTFLNHFPEYTVASLIGRVAVASLCLFLIATISCLAMSTTKQSSSFVWGYFFNGTGWPSDGIVFLTGMVNPYFMYSGIDGGRLHTSDVIHTTFFLAITLRQTPRSKSHKVFLTPVETL